jgi:hypothetical protein
MRQSSWVHGARLAARKKKGKKRKQPERNAKRQEETQQGAHEPIKLLNLSPEVLEAVVQRGDAPVLFARA